MYNFNSILSSVQSIRSVTRLKFPFTRPNSTTTIAKVVLKFCLIPAKCNLKNKSDYYAKYFFKFRQSDEEISK